MSEVNPFPDYAVVRLKVDAGQVRQTTIVTQPISAARAIVEQYTKQWTARLTDKTAVIDQSVTGVRGDYGSGKTHLLLDAAANLQDVFDKTYPNWNLLRAACQETDVLTWFRRAVGPELASRTAQASDTAGALERLMLRVYAMAGQRLAEGGTKFTRGAAERLANEPEAIRKLIRDNLLNISLVDEAFDKLLEHAARAGGESDSDASKGALEVSANVRRALAATVWADTAGTALRWLAGDALTDSERGVIGLSKDLSDAEDAAGVLLAVASAYRLTETPFVVMFDELEHLTRYDESHRGKANTTWLKRLVESLAAKGTLVFLSGHWSAWDSQRDYLERLSQLKPVSLTKLSAEDVIEIVRKRVPRVANAPPDVFGRNQAEAIANASGGTTRRVLTLCRVLFAKTNGFQTALTISDIESAASELTLRIGPDEAALRIRRILELENLAVEADATTDEGIGFDLIGRQNRVLRIVVDIYHAVHQTDQHDRARSFLDRVEAQYNSHPDVVACFFADGNVDKELLKLFAVTRQFRLLWYDLREPDVMSGFVSELRAVLGQTTVRSKGAAVEALSNDAILAQIESRIEIALREGNAVALTKLQEERERAMADMAALNRQFTERELRLRQDLLESLKSQAEELDRRRAREIKELYERLDAERRQAPTRRHEEVIGVQEGEDIPKLHATYAELTRPPTFNKRLRLAMSRQQLLMLAFLIVTGFTLLVGADAFSYALFGEYYPESLRAQLRIICYASGLMLVLTSVALLWQRFARVEEFVEFSARALREVYVRSRSVEDLVTADSILSSTFERSGPFQWKRHAMARLHDELGPAIDTFLERIDYVDFRR